MVPVTIAVATATAVRWEILGRSAVFAVVGPGHHPVVTRPLVTYQGYSGSAIVSADGRTLVVGPYGLECGSTVTVVAREGVAKVGLFLQYTPARQCNPGEGAMAQVTAQRIRLHTPLGDRNLVDGETGTAIAYLSAGLILRPTSIPAGFRQIGLLPWMSASLDPRGARSAACTQIYQARNGLNEFEILQSAAGLQLPGSSWVPITVRGFPGRATADVISWHEHGLNDAIWGPFGTSELVAIADSALSPGLPPTISRGS